ncbi:MAG: amidoligase family protein [Pseudomonadales bacterium]
MTYSESDGRQLVPTAERTREGKLRRVGVELEMQGLSVARLASLVARHLDGEVTVISEYEHEVSGDAAGTWRIELDFDLLKRWGRAEQRGDGARAQIEQLAEDTLAAGSEVLVPMEVVSPPLPMGELARVDGLVRVLRDAGARGTRDGLVYAFGMHFNPELPDTDAATVTRYLKGFLCLYDWLKERSDPDLLRRLSVFIDPFPKEYLRMVLQPGYAPGLPDLIDDYLAHNPTRNRALDMLPLFAHLDERRVRSAIDDPRIKARPTLHYRLPNCEIDEPGWGVTPAWRDWLRVERLAANPDALSTLCAEYADHLDQPLGRLVDPWLDHLESWLRTHDH